MDIEKAFLIAVKDYPNKNVLKVWKQKLKKGKLSEKTMRKYIQEAGGKKVLSEQWEF
jgi:hypothetical protein